MSQSFHAQLEHESRRSFLTDHNMRFVCDYDFDIVRIATAYIKLRIHKQRINFDTTIVDRADIKGSLGQRGRSLLLDENDAKLMINEQRKRLGED